MADRDSQRNGGGTPGAGILRAFKATVRSAAQPPVTEMYPYKQAFYTERSRGAPGLLWNAEVDEIVCTGCGRCETECPDQCIFLTLDRYSDDKTDRKTIVGEFYIDLALCCYCAVCVEVCPYEAIEMTPEFAFSGYSPREMVLDKHELVDIARGLPRRTPNPPRSPGAPKVLDDADRERLKAEREARETARAERAAAKAGADGPSARPTGNPAAGSDA